MDGALQKALDDKNPPTELDPLVRRALQLLMSR